MQRHAIMLCPLSLFLQNAHSLHTVEVNLLQNYYTPISKKSCDTMNSNKAVIWDSTP